jgi:hypothetical protein
VITLPVGAILVVFVSVPLLITTLVALYYNLMGLHRPGRTQESIYECAQCGHVYTFARNRPMDRCPRCNHLNEAVRT